MSTNRETTTQGTEQGQYDDDSINLLDMLLVLLAHKKLITYVTLSAAVISLVASLLLPKIYEGTTRIMPVRGMNSSAAMLNQFSSLAGVARIDIGAQTPSDVYIGILKGDTFADAIIDRFDLMQAFEAEYRVSARKNLAGLFRASNDSKSGIITITVEDKDPEKAALMANAFVEELQA